VEEEGEIGGLEIREVLEAIEVLKVGSMKVAWSFLRSGWIARRWG